MSRRRRKLSADECDGQLAHHQRLTMPGIKILQKYVKYVSLVSAAILLLAVNTFAPKATAATITATSCSQSSVQSAIDGTANGDTVAIPARILRLGGCHLHELNRTRETTPALDRRARV